jgi:chitinase
MDNAKLQRMMSAIKTIKANNQNIPISFTLPVLPEGLVPGVGHNVIVQAQIAGLKDYGVNIMAMDYGNYYNQKTMGEYAIDALTATFSQLKALYPTQSDDVLWSRLEVTPMIGLNDTIPQNFSLNDVDIVKEFAHEKGLRMLSIWSLTRDKPCNHTYASPLCSSQNPVTGEPNQSQDYEFSLRFQ